MVWGDYKMQQGYQYPQQQFGAPPIRHPPEVESIISLLQISAILALVIGILEILWGVYSIVAWAIWTPWLFFPVGGVIEVVLGFISLIVYMNVNKIKGLTENGEYRKAKDDLFIWMILGFISGWIIVGILLLIAYLKFDEVLKPQYPPTPPPQQPYYPPPSIPPEQQQQYPQYQQQPPPPPPSS